MAEEPQLTVESLEAEKEQSFSVPFTLYNTNKLSPNCLFCFVEGKSDTDYYFPKVKSIFGDNHLFINCYNKKFVLKMYQLIHEKDKDTKKLAFFIDHDYDSTVKLEHVYETECYSIENYYCYQSAFSEFLQYGLHIDKTTMEYQEAMNFYIQEFDKFHKAMIDFNAWIAICKVKDQNGEMIHLDKLGSSVPDSFLAKKIGGEYIKSYNLEKINSHFNANPEITMEEHDMMIAELKEKDYYKIFRGKYELHFLYEFLQYLYYRANHKKKGERALLEKSIVSWDINLSKLMIYYSDYAFYPKSLKDFLLSYAA